MPPAAFEKLPRESGPKVQHSWWRCSSQGYVSQLALAHPELIQCNAYQFSRF